MTTTEYDLMIDPYNGEAVPDIFAMIELCEDGGECVQLMFED